jgi:hypothetical protein
MVPRPRQSDDQLLADPRQGKEVVITLMGKDARNNSLGNQNTGR